MTKILQMEEAKTEVEKKVFTLLSVIQNRNNIPKITKKELVEIVNDLHEHFQFLYSLFHDLGDAGRKEKSGARSSSDLDYYSSEETEINAGNVTETLSSDYAVMLTKLQETETRNEDLKRQVSNLNQETDFLRELAGNVQGKRNEDREHFKGLITKDEVALLRNQNKIELESQLEKKTSQVSETKNTEIDRLREENHKLNARIVELGSLEKEKKMNNIDETKEKSKKLDNQVSHLQKLAMEQEDIIHRLSMEVKDQKTLLKEQKDAIDKFSEDQKLMTLNRRIHVDKQIQLESKNNYIKNTQSRENRGDPTVSEIQFKKIKEMVEQGLAGAEMVIEKLEESGELVSRVARFTKEIDLAKKWVQDKNNKMKHEVETLEAKLECREAQESLLKEKLSKLEAKLTEEGTGKLSLEKAMRRIKKLEINVKERDVQLLSLGEEKREAIRQLCVLVDYQRCQYDDVKTSIFNVACLIADDFRLGFEKGPWWQRIFDGYSITTWMVVLNLGSTGLLVSWLMKYADNIVKVYSTSMAMLLTMVASIYLFSFKPTVQLFLGING